MTLYASAWDGDQLHVAQILYTCRSSPYNDKSSAASIHNVHGAWIVNTNTAHTIAHDRSILLVQLDKLASKFASALKPCSPEVAEACEAWARYVVQLLVIVVKSPAAQCHKDNADCGKNRHS